MERVFLGWDGPPLARAVDWLVERFGDDLDGVLVATPGARAGRLLAEQLALRVGPKLRPPRLVTAGLASDELLEVRGVPAGRMVRTLAWSRALRELPAGRLAALVARAPARDDLAAWLRLAEEVRSLFGEVAAEGLDFRAVAEDVELANAPGERRRFEALAAAQERMVALVREAGFVDPHLGRLVAIREECARQDAELRAVCLVGVTELNQLLRRALDLSEVPAHALVFAPESERDRFDEQGGLASGRWEDWHLTLDPEEQWFVALGPADQADRVTRVLASWGGEFAAEEISLGLADRELLPYLEAELAGHGVATRDAAGVPLSRTPPVLLLAALVRFLATETFEDFATLVRHPDFERALLDADGVEHDGGLEPLAVLDAYHAAHLPAFARGDWCEDASRSSGRALARAMRRLWAAAGTVLGDLARPTPAQELRIADVRALLARVYGSVELSPDDRSDRLTAAGLSQVAVALDELEVLPTELVPESGASSSVRTIELLLRGLAGGQVPAEASRSGDATIELLGWLELALDDAPALVVTGFEEGRVPESRRADAYLPGRLRESLGLGDDDGRLARDLYATELLLRSRRRVAFVSGRRSAAGDSKLPSRILFHCDDEQVVARTRRMLQPGRRAEPAATSSGGTPELFRAEPRPAPHEFSVTDFRVYLESPYRYYLERHLALRSLDDRDRELNPLGFGDLAHALLQRFGETEDLARSEDAEAIAAWFSRELERAGRERFGPNPLPAVRLQLEQLDYRLGRFARVQAERAREGWRIAHSEWAPTDGGRLFEVDGEPVRIKGRIDRIDHHPATGRWAIWDYKTGDTANKPANEHLTRSGEWTDLQLPLYCFLAEELLSGAEPAEVGYASIAQRPSDVRFHAFEGWARDKKSRREFREGLESALETARAVVRSIRDRDFFTVDGFAPYDPVLAGIGGVGALVEDDSEEGEA